MKKILLLIAVASLVSACGGGSGAGSAAGTPTGPVAAGQGDTFVSAVLGVINVANADSLDTDSSTPTYDSYAETTPDATIPDTLV